MKPLEKKLLKEIKKLKIPLHIPENIYSVKHLHRCLSNVSLEAPKFSVLFTGRVG